LTSSANRLISDALFLVSPLIPEIFIDDVVQPIVFDAASKIYQFELLQRLFKEPTFARYALARLFANRPPSLEAPMKQEAINFIRSAIQATPPLDPAILNHVMLHIAAQIGHNPDQASPLFILLLGKHRESMQSEQRDLALSVIETLAPRMQTVAHRIFSD
jgi:hypothetical protein